MASRRLGIVVACVLQLLLFLRIKGIFIGPYPALTLLVGFPWATERVLPLHRQPIKNLTEYLAFAKEDEAHQLIQSPNFVGGCQEILQNLQVNKKSVIAAGTVKNVYAGHWKAGKLAVAVLKLRNDKYNGDFSSGMSRLRALQGHSTIWPLLAVCPKWNGYVEYDSEEYLRIYQENVNLGHTTVFNTAVTTLSKYGTLEDLDEVLQEGPFSNNWQSRLHVAIDFLRCMAFLHNLGEEQNGLNASLVQKDFKISQFLLADDLTVKLNDAEAMPTTNDPKELAEDSKRIPLVLNHVFGSVPRPTQVDDAIADIIHAANTGSQTTSWMLHRLILTAHLTS